MSLDKKGFAEIIESAINECKCISSRNKYFAENVYLSNNVVDDIEYKYNKYMKKLALSKIKRLYSILSLPAKSRILSMTDEEIEEYRKDKIGELSNSINRLMLAMEVSNDGNEKNSVKKKIEALVEEQTNLKEMPFDVLKRHIIDKLELDITQSNESFDGKGETEVLQNIMKNRETLSIFIDMVSDYRKLEKEIKSVRAEQIIIYNDLFNGSVKGNISIEDLFSEESLNGLQATIAEKISEISVAENDLKKYFSSKTKKAFNKIKSDEYKSGDGNKILPYDNSIFEVFEEFVPSRTFELAKLQNEEWLRLNKKMFKTSDVNSTLSILSMEIDETKALIDSFVRSWYKNSYYDNSLFGPISSRVSGKFEYSLGAKNCLDEFINLGIWPEEKDINTLKLCLKLNRIEAEKSIIYAEQIKERLTRLFNVSLDSKKNELEELEKRITSKFGNWKNEVILSIVNETK